MFGFPLAVRFSGIVGNWNKMQRLKSWIVEGLAQDNKV